MLFFLLIIVLLLSFWLRQIKLNIYNTSWILALLYLQTVSVLYGAYDQPTVSVVCKKMKFFYADMCLFVTMSIDLQWWPLIILYWNQAVCEIVI